jgi:uncharacterized RDD family membrane protein YckC
MEATAAHLGAGTDTRLATPPQRLSAWLLDAFIAGLAFTPLTPVLYSSHPSPALFLALWVPTILLLFVYLVLFDGGRRGATPGKRIVGIRVVDARTGAAIGYRRAAIRRLGYLLGGLVLYVGWLWLLFDPRRQAWHDKLAGSIVVRFA